MKSILLQREDQPKSDKGPSIDRFRALFVYGTRTVNRNKTYVLGAGNYYMAEGPSSHPKLQPHPSSHYHHGHHDFSNLFAAFRKTSLIVRDLPRLRVEINRYLRERSVPASDMFRMQIDFDRNTCRIRLLLGFQNYADFLFESRDFTARGIGPVQIRLETFGKFLLRFGRPCGPLRLCDGNGVICIGTKIDGKPLRIYHSTETREIET